MADSERLALADRLDTEHQHRSPWATLGCTCPVCPDLRAAARALRKMDAIEAAIGDVDELRRWVDDHNGIMLRKAAGRITDAVGGPE